MKVIHLRTNPEKYSSNVYLVLGDWNKIEDQNTLIDVGIDDYIVSEIENINTGFGKKKISQVIITHEHFDHKGALKVIKELYNPIVYAANKTEHIDVKVTDWMRIKVGDQNGIILHTPGHSSDSICIYVQESKVLFSGDTPVIIKSSSGTYTKEFVHSLEKLSILEIDTIYPGHGEPIYCKGLNVIRKSLEKVYKSKII